MTAPPMSLTERVVIVTGANLLADLGMTSLLLGREPYAPKPIAGS